jgi:hypothetical protein
MASDSGSVPGHGGVEVLDPVDVEVVADSEGDAVNGATPELEPGRPRRRAGNGCRSGCRPGRLVGRVRRARVYVDTAKIRDAINQ